MTCRRDDLFHKLTTAVCVWLLAACSPGAPEPARLEQARMELAAGRPQDAQVILNRLLEEGADPAELSAYLGEAALAQGDLIEAGNWLGPSGFAEPSRAHGFRMQGRLAMARDDLVAAGQAYDRALALEPGNPGLWVDIGRLRYRGGEQLQAIEAAERAVELGPEDPSALQFRGQLARDSHGMQAGVLWFERALKLQPDNADLRLDLAATLGDAGQAREALSVLREGGTQLTASPRGLFIQSVIAARGGNLSVARDLLDRSQQYRQEIPAGLLLSAIIDIEGENFGAAAQTLDRLLAKQPDNGRVIDLLAYSLSRSGGENELVRRFAERARGANGSTYLRTLVGRAFESLGDRAKAARFLDAATGRRVGLAVLPGVAPSASDLRGDRSNARNIRDAIRAEIRSGQTSSALARAKALAGRFPGSGDVLALLGDAELANGNRQAAMRAYARSAMIRQPWSLAPRYASSLDDANAVAAYLQDYLAGNPTNGEAAAMLADAYAAKGRWEDAATLLDHAISLGHGRVPWVLAARSIAAMQSGDHENALTYALAATELQPMNPHALIALIAALPEGEDEAKAELTLKLHSVLRN